MKVCIIGCGSIGSTLAKAMEEMDEIQTMYITDNSKERVISLTDKCKKVVYFENFEDIVNNIELAIEAASQEAAKKYTPLALENGKDILVMSVGAFVDDDFRGKCKILAKQNKCRIYIPAGALCGIDGMGSAVQAEIEEVMLISYKPPDAFQDIKYLTKRKIDVNSFKRPQIVFNGLAKDAVKHFPKNINVAATISLAGIGFEKTRVKIVVDPNATRNTHRIIVKGKFGEIECRARNLPFPENPKTSYLAALAAISAVKKIVGNVWVGV